MANPTQAQIDKLTVNLERWDDIVNGGVNDTVVLDDTTVKTVTGYLYELRSFNIIGAWGTATSYSVKDLVLQSGSWYACLIAHTSGTFATDLAAGKWVLYQIDFSSNVAFAADFTVDTNVFHVNSTTNKVGIGTTTLTKKLTMGVSGFDGFSINISGFAHGVTNKIETDTVAGMYAYGGTNGGLYFVGVNKSVSENPISFDAVFVNDPNTNVAGFLINVGLKSGVSTTGLGATKTIFQLKNNTTAMFSVLGNGNFGINNTNPSVALDVVGEALFGNGTIKPYISYSVGNSTAILGTNSAHGVEFRINNSEKMRLNSSGKLLIGTTQAVSTDSENPIFHIYGTSLSNASMTIRKGGSDASPGVLFFSKTRGASDGTAGIVSSGDRIGTVAFIADDGTDLNGNSALIYAEVDGTPGTNDLPGRLVFATSADGSASASVRMTIKNDGKIGINTSSPSEFLDVNGVINAATSLKIATVKVIGAQGSAVSDASGGAVIDIEARAAINTLLARLRASTGHGLIA